MGRAIVDAGICGFHSEIFVSTEDDMWVKVLINTDCPDVTRLAQALEGLTLNGFRETMRMGGSAQALTPLQEAFHRDIPHPGCPVYSGIIKAIEVTLGTALPADARIQVLRD